MSGVRFFISGGPLKVLAPEIHRGQKGYFLLLADGVFLFPQYPFFLGEVTVEMWLVQPVEFFSDTEGHRFPLAQNCPFPNFWGVE